MSNTPEWLSNWLTIDESDPAVGLSFHSEKVTNETNRTLVKINWQGENTQKDYVQLDMILKDDTTKCVWKPHLSPEEDMVNGDLFFYSPAMIFERSGKLLALIPDLDFLEKNRVAPHFMDYVLADNHIFYGLGDYDKTHHVYHKRNHQPFTTKPETELFQFHLVEWDNRSVSRDFTPVTTFIWETYGKDRMKAAIKSEKTITNQLEGLEKYATYTYEWAFNHWQSIVWQEFKISQTEVGGCAFLVRAAQKPGYGKENIWREKKSIWNQAWFSSLRSAYGYRLWGEKWHVEDMIKKSQLAKEFALSAPQKNGLFPGIYLADENEEWGNGSWAHSNRRPDNHEKFGHLLDMSWTCYWMLKWYRDIEKDQRLLVYSLRYATKLLSFQNSDGSFPAWVDDETDEISPFLKESAETSMHAWFLADLYQVTSDARYLLASEKAIDFVIENIVPEGKWEDFETY